MRINLQEIPEAGKSFSISSKTGELNEVLSDLIGDLPYQADFQISVINQTTFELTGWVKTETVELCSRCGIDFNWNVDQSFKELMLPEIPPERNSHYSKPNHFSEMTNEDLTTVSYQGHHFDIGEYIHEVIAISIPFNPSPAKNSKGDCSLCLVSVESIQQEKKIVFDEELEKPVSPFSALKGIKLN
jgi:uncharacterized protein